MADREAIARQWLSAIHRLPLDRPVRIMNVCGGHERAISQAGLRSILPEQVGLIAGPGCPVCVCPEQDVWLAIRLALDQGVTLVAFGDMLRVPVNVPAGEPRSLAEAAASGADVRPVATPVEAVRIARQEPHRQVVFFAAGFETTMAPVAATLAEARLCGQMPDNFSVLLSGRLTWPAVAKLLDSGQAMFDALIAPGHVAAVMGADEWQFVPQQHGLPAAVASFEPAGLLAAMHSVLMQVLEGAARLDNCYPEVVRPAGNPVARRWLGEVFRVTDAGWRGIGIMPASGYDWQDDWRELDARIRFPVNEDPQRRRAGDMPPGCDCAKVVLGQIDPDQCRLYGRACTPRKPVGPCMVSDEGACHIWWTSGRRRPEQVA